MSESLKLIDERMPEAELVSTLKATLHELEPHKALLEAKHVKGAAYVAALFGKVPQYIEASAAATTEQAEALSADTERAASVEAGRSHIRQVRDKVELIIDQLGAPSDDASPEAKQIQALRYDFGLRGPRWRIDINSHVDELLEQVHVGVHKHKALFESAGEDDAFFAKPREAKQAIEDSARSHQKERNESILATRWANALRDEVEDLVNMALRIVNTHAAGSELQQRLLNLQRERAGKLG